MSSSIRTLALVAALAAGVAISSPPAAAAGVEGTDFRRIEPPQPTDSAGKIEVIEFFSFGCPHCAHFEPMVREWLAKLPRDVAFKRIPVSFNRAAWVNLQRTFYSLQSTGDLGKLTLPLFRAIHEDHLPLADEEQPLLEWVARNGGNAQAFATAYTSFLINSETFQADRQTEQYGIEGVPALAVGGRYVAMASSEHGEAAYLAQLLTNTDELIARVRAETHAPAAPAAAAPAAQPPAH